MDGLLKCGELDAALELVEFMRHAGLAPSAVSHFERHFMSKLAWYESKPTLD